MLKHFITFALALALTLPAMARSLTGEEKAALAEFVTRYETAFLEKNYWFLGKAIPPLLMKKYVASRGDPDLEPDLWIALFVADSKKIDRQIGNVRESFSLNFPDVRYAETSDGTPYAILPSTSVIALNSGERVKISSPHLALLDGGNWYLVNVGFGGLMGSVKGVYEAFDDVDFDYAKQEKL